MSGEENLDRFKNLDFIRMDRRTFLKAVGALGASLFLQTYRGDIVRALEFAESRIVVITSYSIHYTKLYDSRRPGPTTMRTRRCRT